MNGLVKIFTQGLVLSAGSVVGTVAACYAIAELSDPVKRTKIKKKFTNVKNEILKK